MNVFLENIWIWFSLAFIVGITGYGFFLRDRKIQTLGITVIASLAILAVGFVLYYFVDTDYKSVDRMLRSAARSIEQDDLPGILSHVKPEAIKTQDTAKYYLRMVLVPTARFSNLKVVVNDLTSPPVAKATFTATVYWRTRQPVEGFAMDRPVMEKVFFDIELEKTNDQSWLVTDDCHFTFRSSGGPPPMPDRR